MDKIIEWIITSFEKIPIIIGVQGIQGCGKSTLCETLEKQAPETISIVSLDDFYKKHSEILRARVL